MTGIRRHRLHNEIVALVQAGETNLGIARKFGIDKRAAARVRQFLGLPMGPRYTTPSEKVARFSEPREDGHVGWNGRRVHGIPKIRQFDVSVSASHVVFRDHVGRDPVGIVRIECDFFGCLNPLHLSDEIQRRQTRLIERSLHGLEAVWDVCPKGVHEWEEHGRIEPYPSLKPYCATCNTDRVRRLREARKEERNTA